MDIGFQGLALIQCQIYNPGVSIVLFSLTIETSERAPVLTGHINFLHVVNQNEFCLEIPVPKSSLAEDPGLLDKY